MPVYEYICKQCGSKVEMLRRFFERNENTSCPVCGQAALERQPSNFNTGGQSCGTIEYSGG